MSSISSEGATVQKLLTMLCVISAIHFLHRFTENMSTFQTKAMGTNEISKRFNINITRKTQNPAQDHLFPVNSTLKDTMNSTKTTSQQIHTDVSSVEKISFN